MMAYSIPRRITAAMYVYIPFQDPLRGIEYAIILYSRFEFVIFTEQTKRSSSGKRLLRTCRNQTNTPVVIKKHRILFYIQHIHPKDPVQKIRVLLQLAHFIFQTRYGSVIACNECGE